MGADVEQPHPRLRAIQEGAQLRAVFAVADKSLEGVKANGMVPTGSDDMVEVLPSDPLTLAIA